jgi:RimJ/RimL family protein N-acetyltransferase
VRLSRRRESLTPFPFPAARERGDLLTRHLGVVLVVERIDDNGPIGIVEYKPTDGWMTVRFIGLAKAYRGWGYGSEALRLLEEWAALDRLAERFRAEVDAHNGLGLYFWLRLGYRPVGRAERAAWHLEGSRDSMAMVRNVSG